MNNKLPQIILLISGKRKSGKDFISELLFERLGSENATIIRLSSPIKSYWAKSNDLKLDELLSSGNYKESYRKEMIAWSEQVRRADYGHFCRAAIHMAQGIGNKPVWIISDTRRKTDLQWFNENYKETPLKTIRIVASEETRKARGWTFLQGVDDGESECDLDSIDGWDLVFYNDNNEAAFERQFNDLIDMCNNVLASESHS